MRKTKNSYHTSLIFKTQLDALSKKEKDMIPKTTRYDWKKRNLSQVIGFEEDPIYIETDLYQRALDSETFKKALRALFRVYSFYDSLSRNIPGKRRIWSEQKQKIVSIIQKISPSFGIRRSCRLLNISVQRFYKWKNEILCKISPLGLCRKSNPKQLTLPEQKTISSYLKNPIYENWPLRSIFYKILNDGKAFLNLSTFYKYAKILNPNRNHIRKKKQRIGIRSNKPLELLHMDTTILRTLDNSKVYIHFIMDNFSRTILGWKASLEWNSKNTMQNLKEVCQKFNLFNKPLSLLCDDGSENTGAVNKFLSQSEVSIRKIIAQVDIIFSNSMIEAVNKKMKYEFLFPKKPFSFNDVNKILEQAVPEFNSRPSGVLYGYTPNEVLAGAVPDKLRFATQIKDAVSERAKKNREDRCQDC